MIFQKFNDLSDFPMAFEDVPEMGAVLVGVFAADRMSTFSARLTTITFSAAPFVNF